mgnify:CR=1 FL=1
MLIEPNEINKILSLASTQQINRGKKYYEQDRVKILNVNINDDKNFKINTAIKDVDSVNYFVGVEKVIAKSLPKMELFALILLVHFLIFI